MEGSSSDAASESVDSFLRAAAATERAPIAAGTTIGDHYRVERLLGRGGMGEVHRAVDVLLGRAVALKVLHAGIDATDLLREARVAASLAHPRIATVFEAGVDRDRVFIAMELVEGKTVRELLARGALPKPRVLAIARAVAEALVHAHAHRVVHRDVKPENVIVGPEGAKLVDFGIATDGDDRVRRGTPGYMAPEQIRRAAVTDRTDVFAFGLLLHELATGERPARGEGETELAARDVQGAATRLRTPSYLRSIVRRCVGDDPWSRPSMREVRAALEADSSRARALSVVALIVIALALVPWRRRAESTIASSVAPTTPAEQPAPSASAAPSAKPIVSATAAKIAYKPAPPPSASTKPSTKLEKGETCARSSECASGWCVAEVCQ
jgi:serine/threonine-protein kinase